MTIKVGATLTCDNCGEEEFIPHADTGDAEAKKVRQGEWKKEIDKSGEILDTNHYCPDCREDEK